MTKVHRLGVLTFDYGSHDKMGAEDIFAKFLIERGYSVIERSRLEAILQEQKLSVEGVFSHQSAKDIGKILGVDALLLGQLTDYIPERTSMINVETSQTYYDPVFRTKERKQSDGSVVQVQEQVGSTVRREQTKYPQFFPIDAQVGVTVKLVDVETGEIIWIGSYTSEGVTAQIAMESVANYLVKQLSKRWKAQVS